MKTAFMGTPVFAVPSLAGMLEAGYRIPVVITQPDRPSGRGKKVCFSAVKQFALEHNLTVEQPVKKEKLVGILQKHQVDCVVVVAYGRILPSDLLDYPQYGCLNVHASLLPKYRGASPINWALVCGERFTGITTMLISPKMDTGDILLQEKLEIGPRETAGELSGRLALSGAQLLIKTLRLIETGTAKPVPQNHRKATYCPLLKKPDGEIPWEKSAEEIYNLVRGFHPWPGTFTFYLGKRLVITSVTLAESFEIADKNKPGQLIWDRSAKALYAATGDGWLKIERVKPENRKEMSAPQFVAGLKGELGIMGSGFSKGAAIDVGTNTVRLIAAKGTPDDYRILGENQEITRLGEGVGKTKRLKPQAVERTVEAISRFVDQARGLGVSRISVFCTSAARRAENGHEFLHSILEQTGIKPEIITGEKEAELTLLGVRKAIELNDALPMLLIDIGGGSTEFILSRGDKIKWLYSLNLGSVVLAESFYNSADALSPGQVKRMESYIEGKLTEVMKRIKGKPVLVGTAGTITTLAAINMNMARYDPQRINNYRLALDSLEKIARDLYNKTLLERYEIIGLERGRADVIPAGVILLNTIMRLIGSPEIVVSDGGLREGILIDLLKGNN